MQDQGLSAGKLFNIYPSIYVQQPRVDVELACIKGVKGAPMKHLLIATALLLASCFPAMARNGQGHDDDNEGHGYRGNEDHGYRGAPGPILGAGLPVLAIGYGVYWLVRRRRKSDQ